MRSRSMSRWPTTSCSASSAAFVTGAEFDRWVERDLAYIDRWSLLLDLTILLRTVPAVIGRTGK